MSETARKALEDLEERCRARDPDAAMEERFTTTYPLARHVFLARQGRLVYPAAVSPPGSSRPGRFPQLPGGHFASDLDVEDYVGRLRESRRIARFIALARQAEHEERWLAAQALYTRAGRGRGVLAAQTYLGLARVQRRQGQLQAARETYAALRRRFEERQDDQGVSYALLADAGSAEVGPTSLLPTLHERLLGGEYATTVESRRFYLRWTLDRLAGHRSVAPATLAQLRRSTSRLFAAEQFGALLLRHGITELELAASDSIGSVSVDRRTILVLRRRGDTLVGYSLDDNLLRRRLASHHREVVPPGRGTALVLDRLGAAASVPRERILHASVLAPPLGDWTLAAIRPDTDPMDLLERRQGLRRQGFVVGLILVLLAGLVLTHRGVRRESELAQLKSDFASNVSHELKTPLTSIRMYAEMLEQGIAATPEDRQRYERVIIRESERLGRLIANILDFSRVERGIRRYDLCSEDVEELTREAVDTFARLSEGEEIAIRLHRGGSLPRVTADREAAVQSVLNLLSNAAKYSRDVPQIEVVLRVSDREAGIEVRDQGIGIPVSEQKRIFDDFYRAPGARTAGVEGTGLGLALVRRHMLACGGRVEVSSSPGKGSSFTLWFVAAPSKEARDADDPGHRG
jgi:signal transduction histidine kinase